MEVCTFEYLWEQGIAKAAQDVIAEIPANLQSKYIVNLDISESMREKAYQEYETLRKEVRKKYFDSGEKDENRIDGHKICACITGALLNVRLVSYNIKDENIPIKIVLSNYAIAFLASIYVMYLFLLSDFERDGKEEYYYKLKELSTFEFPETNPGHDPYVQGRIKTLALNDLYGNEFDVLTYADMLFWIEKYNIDRISNSILNACYGNGENE